MTVQEVMDGIIKKTGVSPLPEDKTCDIFIIGDRNREVKKIGTTFMATVDVIREAIEKNIDFIITHEPTWFTGMDDTEWVKEDPVYLEKKKLLEEHGISIWRFHDHMHMAGEDGIYRGFEQEYDWAKYRMPGRNSGNPMDDFGGCYEIPETSLKDLCAFFKEKSDMQVVQIVGDPQMKVKRAAVLVGGGSLGLGVENMPMRLMREKNIDLAICGDITEWTLSAYVRDASQLGMNKAMLVLGHERSEEPGMKYLPEWMKSIVGDIEVQFLDAKEPFLYL